MIDPALTNPASSSPCSDPASWQTVAAEPRKPFVLLDDNTGRGTPSALYTDPVEIIRAESPAEVPAALARLEAAAARGLHAAGFFAYELGYVLEPRLAHLLPANRTVPLLWFGLFRAPAILSSADVQSWLAARTQDTPLLTEISHSWDGPAYESRFAKAAAYIQAGDIYQINLTLRARFKLIGSPIALYRELRQKQRVAYGGIIETGDLTILSASPELFIERSGQRITTRPMKGTSPRAASETEDAEARRILATDTKQRAENLMIVDLMRNDLGRIAGTGSVHVTDLFTVETFKTLHQLTSGVSATLKEGTSLVTLLEAIFPPGSITGAPKIRAMEIIAELEDEPRGVYCGAIGRISPDGHSLFNVAIRTAVFTPGGHGEMGIGSGVVADSMGPHEYAECLLKMKFLTDKVRRFQLIETLLFDSADPALARESGFAYLDGHLQRLATSARYFGFRCDSDAARAALASTASRNPTQRQRVRLLLDEEGGITVTSSPLPAASPGATLRYVISPTRLKSTDLYLFHKTTERQLYDREWQHYHDTIGADEVLYLNENGDLTEGSRTSIFLARGGDRDGETNAPLLTPQLSAGLLPGVLRAHLIATGRAFEQRLTPSDLTTGTLYLGNSVRGLVKAAAIGG